MNRSPMRPGRTSRERTVYNRPIRGEPCAYCQAPAVNADHVVPRSVVRAYNQRATDEMPSIPVEWLAVEPACFPCNILKGSRRLVPPSWAKHVPAMNEFFGGTQWRVWTGDTSEPAFAEAWR